MRVSQLALGNNAIDAFLNAMGFSQGLWRLVSKALLRVTSRQFSRSVWKYG